MRTPSLSLSLVSVRPLFLSTGPRPFLWIFHSWPPTYAEAHGEEILYHMDRGGPPHAQRYTHTLSCARPLSLFSMGTVRADTALFGQPLLVISARLYSQSMVAHTHTQSPHCHEDHVCLCLSGLHAKWKLGPDPSPHDMSASRKREARKAASQEAVAVLIREDRSMMMLLLQNRPATATWERMPHTQVLTHTHTHTVTPSAGSNTKASFQKIAF